MKGMMKREQKTRTVFTIAVEMQTQSIVSFQDLESIFLKSSKSGEEMDKYIPFMSVDELIENDIHTPENITGTNVENSRFISIQEVLDAVEESRRLNHHKNAKEACAHEYEHRHFLKILWDIKPADVAQIRHSRWIKTEDGAECEKCGREAVYQIVDDHWEYEPWCPHCGAIMNVKE